MKHVLFLTVALIVKLHAQVLWSPPVQITFGSGSDIQPALISTHSSAVFLNPASEEWLAFTRLTLIGSAVCLMKTNVNATAWIDSVYCVAEDSGVNLNPSLARYSPSPNETRLMLVWTKISGIYFSYNPNGVWLAPRQLSGGGVNRAPHVAAFDSGFGIVWEHNGRIAFSEFRDTNWSQVSYVTGDTAMGNSSPQIHYVGYSGPLRPLVIWEKLRLVDSSRAILYALRSDTGWTIPDTIAWSGDNRNPRFYRLGFSTFVFLSYESDRSGPFQIYLAQGDFTSGSVSWWYRGARFTNTSSDEQQSTFTLLPIITDRTGNESFWYTGGTWRTSTGSSDSIAVASPMSFIQHLSAGAGAIDRNPTVSSGVPGMLGWRVWSVWESNASGEWKLYGSTADIPLSSVDEQSQRPTQFRLYQNFPNPFNPLTTIRFDLPERSMVSLKIYNLLGQEIATLYGGELGAGIYTVRWHAHNVPSGVYVYQLTANHHRAFRKLIVVK